MRGHVRPVLWIALALVATGCSRKPETPAASGGAPPPASAPSAPPAAVDPAAASVMAVALGPAKLPLTIRFALPAPPVVGQSAKLNLTVAADQSLQRVEIDGSSQSLAIDPATATLSIDALEPGRAYPLELDFTPRTAGLSDVEFEVRVQTGDGELQSRYAIPVLSAGAAAAP